MAAAASSSAGREALTRLSTPIKDAALEAAKRAKPQWHLIDAKDQVCGCGVPVDGMDGLFWRALWLGSISSFLSPTPSDHSHAK